MLNGTVIISRVLQKVNPANCVPATRCTMLLHKVRKRHMSYITYTCMRVLYTALHTASYTMRHASRYDSPEKWPLSSLRIFRLYDLWKFKHVHFSTLLEPICLCLTQLRATCQTKRLMMSRPNRRSFRNSALDVSNRPNSRISIIYVLQNVSRSTMDHLDRSFRSL